MRINPIMNYPHIVNQNSTELKVGRQSSINTNAVAFINFKGGNKEQVIMFGVEIPPYNKAGGVATVMQDFRALRVSENDPLVTNEMKNSFEFYAQKNKVLVDPIYNGKITYNPDNGIVEKVEVPKVPSGLEDGNPFKKYEGKYFQTTNGNLNNYTDIKDFFEKENLDVGRVEKSGIKGNVFILEEIPNTARKIDFGGLEESESKLFRVQLEVNGELRKTNDFKIFTDLTATLKDPYSKGGYSTTPGKLNQTWKGVADAKAAKAFIEYMPEICEQAGSSGIKFDPATLILNDSQAGYASEYMAQKVSKGAEFWKGKKAIFVGHNLGDGYVQRTSYMNMFVNIADKELRNAVYNDSGFIDAAREGSEAVSDYFKKLLPEEFFDAQKQVSPFKNTVYWAERGLVTKIHPVSEKYAEALATDPEFAPSIYKYLKELKENGVFEGIVNAFENVEMNPATTQGVGGYYKDSLELDINGNKVKIEPIKAFDAEKIKEGAVDVNYVREIKRQNKVNLFTRFDEDVLKELTRLKETKGHEKDFNNYILGLKNKDAKVYGYVKKDILLEAQKEGGRVKLLAAWGRSDAQKAMDSVLRSYINYLKTYGNQDKYSVLFVGGPTADETEKCVKLIKQYAKDPDIAGRVVYIDGFLPNKPFASAADFTVFPSRFAPCELTDLESMKMFASPIVTDIQGLSQKNFDASFEGEAEKVTGYKTKHAYTMHLDEIKANLSSEDNVELDNAVKKFRKKIKSDMHMANVTDEMVTEKILSDATLNFEYNFDILRPFRDKIIENDLTECYRRALIDDSGKEVQDLMLQNHRLMKTDWENNVRTKLDGISSAKKYRSSFQTDPKPIKEEDTLLSKLRNNCSEIIENYKKTQNSATSDSAGAVVRSRSAKGKWAIGIAAGIALIGGGLAIMKNSNKNKVVQNSNNVLLEEEYDEDFYDIE